MSFGRTATPRLTGMFTSPKLMAPFHIARSMILLEAAPHVPLPLEVQPRVGSGAIQRSSAAVDQTLLPRAWRWPRACSSSACPMTSFVLAVSLLAAAPRVVDIQIYTFDRKSGEMSPIDPRARPTDYAGDLIAIVRTAGA